MLDRVIHDDDPPTLATFAKVIYTISAGQVILSENRERPLGLVCLDIGGPDDLGRVFDFGFDAGGIPPAWPRSGHSTFCE
jgi:hypothetical protein